MTLLGSPREDLEMRNLNPSIRTFKLKRFDRERSNFHKFEDEEEGEENPEAKGKSIEPFNFKLPEARHLSDIELSKDIGAQARRVPPQFRSASVDPKRRI